MFDQPYLFDNIPIVDGRLYIDRDPTSFETMMDIVKGDKNDIHLSDLEIEFLRKEMEFWGLKGFIDDGPPVVEN